MNLDRLAFARGLGYEHKRASENLDTLQRPGSPFTIGLEATNARTILPYFYVRTSSWNWPGERSDLNDVLATLFAVLLRTSLTASCRFVEVAHPATYIPGELYARYLLPEQPFATGYPGAAGSLHDCLHDSLQKLVTQSFAAEEFSYMILRACGAEYHAEGTYEAGNKDLRAWAEHVQELFGHQGSSVTYNARTLPTWWYYRTASGAAVVRSDVLVKSFAVFGRHKDGRSVQRGPNGLLIRDQNMCSYIPATLEKRARKILRKLNGNRNDAVTFIALENQVVAATGSHCLFLHAKAGRREFEREVERWQRKHAAEARFLYHDLQFAWEDHIDGGRFQSLINELLLREPGVSRVRPAGSATERDGTRDYLVDWTTPVLPAETADEGSPPSKLRRVAVQCKSNRAPVNRTQVTGVYDTMEHYNAGYLLVVRSRLTVPLIDILDGIRAKGRFAEWWEGTDVEKRLHTNPDLLEKYADIVRPS